MSKAPEQTHLPVETFNANLKRLGRSMDADTGTRQGWVDGEYGLHITWSDGFVAFVGFGPEASAMIEGWSERKH